MTMPARSCEAVIMLDLLSVRILRLRRFGVAVVVFLAVVVILNLVGGLLRRTAARRHVPREKDRLDSCAYRVLCLAALASAATTRLKFSRQVFSFSAGLPQLDLAFLRASPHLRVGRFGQSGLPV